MNKKNIFTIVFICILAFIVQVILVISFVDTSKKNTNVSTTTTTNNIISTTTSVTTTNTTVTSSTSTIKLPNTIVTSTTSSNKTTTTSKVTSSNKSTSGKTTVTTTKSTTKKKTTTKKRIVNQTYEHDNTTDIKFGVKIYTDKMYLITHYSDGSKKSELISNSIRYNRSEYNASLSELETGARKMVTKNNSIYNEMLSYVNQYRKEVNVEDLTLDDELSVLASIRALELGWGMGVERVLHERPDGRSWHTVYTDMNYSHIAAGENIAAGQDTVSYVSNAWKKSEGHYKNMISTNYTKAGFGVVEVDNVKYWVQLFAK